MLATLFVLATIFAVSAMADLAVLSPGGPNLWWVAQSQNTLVWDCKSSQVQNFTVLIANTDAKILSGPLALIAIQSNYQCSIELAKELLNASPGSGYTLQLANPLNQTEVYAQSQPFEVKPLGATYPDTSATPTAGVSATESASAAGASGTDASAQRNNGVTLVKSAGSGAIAAVVAVIGFAT